MKNLILFFTALSLVFFIQASEKTTSHQHAKKINLLVLQNQKKVFRLQKEEERILSTFDTQMSYKIKNAHTMQEKNNIREVYSEMRAITLETYAMWEYYVYQNTMRKIYNLHKQNKKNIS